MLKPWPGRPSPAMIVAVTALISALAGPAIADQAVGLAKRAKLIDGSKIKPRSVSANRLKSNALTGTEIDESKLGKVSSATRADSATSATSAARADSATHASSADSATSATNATNAINATNANHATSADDAATLNGTPASAFAPPLWAVIEATGTGASVVRQNGHASNPTRLGNGLFTVTFDRDITNCAYTATIGSTADDAAPAYYATVEQRTGFNTDIRLRSWDATGSLADPGAGGAGFHVAVFC
jgi:hypothetical protein